MGDKSNHVVFDNSKLKKYVPDFTCSVSFREGYQRVLDYYMKHPELQIIEDEYNSWCDAVIDAQEQALESIINLRQKKEEVSGTC